jgi:hypothetical protein
VLLPLCTLVRGRGVLGTSLQQGSPKYARPRYYAVGRLDQGGANFVCRAFSEVRREVSNPAHMAYAPRSSVLDTWVAIAARGGGLYPFFHRPAKENGVCDETDRPTVGFEIFALVIRRAHHDRPSPTLPEVLP